MNEKLTVLIVDDNSLIRLNLKKILEKNNFNTIEAENGKIALKAIENHLPDLVLLDVMMPVMNGEETLKEIRARFKIGELPVIIVTSNSDRLTLKNLVSLGCQDFIVKPFDYNVLIIKIQEMFSDPLLKKGQIINEKSQKIAEKIGQKLDLYFEEGFLELIYNMVVVKNSMLNLSPKFTTSQADKKMINILKEVVSLKRVKSDLMRTISRTFHPTDDEILDAIISLAKGECDRICKDLKTI